MSVKCGIKAQRSYGPWNNELPHRPGYFIINPKYAPTPEAREDLERLQEQDVNSNDIGPTWIRLTQGDSVMEGPESLVYCK